MTRRVTPREAAAAYRSVLRLVNRYLGVPLAMGRAIAGGQASPRLMGATTPAWTLWVPGEPRAMQTGSIVRTKAGRAFPVRRRTEWANRIALAANAAPPPALFEGPLSLQLVFYRTRPKSLSKRVVWPLTQPDVDNYIKGLADALQGIVYRNDSQLVMLLATKRFAAHGTGPGVRITVEALDAMSTQLPG